MTEVDTHLAAFAVSPEACRAANLVRPFLALFVPAALVLALAGVVHYAVLRQADEKANLERERLNVELVRDAVRRTLDQVSGDLGYLAERSRRLLEWPDGRRRIAEAFVLFADHRRVYDQVRLVDRAGHEWVRVNYDDPAGARAVAEADLQDKAGRYYVREAWDRPVGAIYVSPLDLNIEDQRIQRPLKPVMRFATRVAGGAAAADRLLILNYLGQQLTGQFRRASGVFSDHVHLLNADGYWLDAPDPALNWGFQLEGRPGFFERYPDLWQRVSGADREQVLLDAGLLTSVGVGGPLDPGWKIASFLPRAAFAVSPAAFARTYGPLYLGMFSLLFASVALATRARCRQRLASAREDYQRRFQQTLRDVELAAVTLDPAGRITYFNPCFQALVEVGEGAVIGRDFVAAFVPESQRAQVRRVIESIGDSARFPRRFESRLVSARGTRRLVDWRTTPHFDNRGRADGFTAIGEDVTLERQQAEQVTKLNQAVVQSPSMVVITDHRGLIEYVNPKFTEVTGYTADEVVGQNPRLLKSGETTAEDYAELWTTIRAGGEWRGEFHNRRKNGELYWEAASISAIRDAEGRISHFVAVKEDITERKRLEQEVDLRNRELSRAQTLASLGRMAGMIAHDLRNPLSSIKMTVTMLGRPARPQASDNRAELVAIAADQIQYMEDLITDVLSFSRPEPGSLDWLELEKVLALTVSGLSRRLREPVRMALPEGLPRIPGDARRLRQLFGNLLVNADQAMETSGTGAGIDVEAELVGSAGAYSVEVRIGDRGAGVDPDLRERMFEPFVTGRARGTGLGLAIVRQVLDQHGGRIALDARPGGGTLVRVGLPIQPTGAAAEPR